MLSVDADDDGSRWEGLRNLPNSVCVSKTDYKYIHHKATPEKKTQFASLQQKRKKCASWRLAVSLFV